MAQAKGFHVTVDTYVNDVVHRSHPFSEIHMSIRRSLVLIASAAGLMLAACSSPTAPTTKGCGGDVIVISSSIC